MKLLFCPDCGDMFSLGFKLKQCTCGNTKGKYINNSDSVNNGYGVSVAIGNGSFWRAQAALCRGEFKEDWDRKAGSEPPVTSFVAWVRANEGPTNPHSKVDETL